MRSLQIPTQRKKEPYYLYNIEGQPVVHNQGTINFEVWHLKVKIQGTWNSLDLDITRLGSTSIILGMNWLQKNNPKINWWQWKIELGKGIAMAVEVAPLLPPIYHEYQELVEERAEALSPHQPWDYEIKLKDDAHL